MNLLDFETTPLWLVWETVRELAAEDGVELAESELIGLAPLAAFLAVADHAGAPRDDPIERRLAAAAGLPAAARLLARCRPSSSGSRPPGPVGPAEPAHDERRPVPGHQGRADATSRRRAC